MGSYDNLTNGKQTNQCKIYHCELNIYNIGDKVPPVPQFPQKTDTYTIVFPRYEPFRFAIIKDGKLFKLTNSTRNIKKPYIDKWGNLLEKPEDCPKTALG